MANQLAEVKLVPAELDTLLRRHSVLTSLLVSGYVDHDVTPGVACLLPQVIFLGNNQHGHGYLRLYTDRTNYLYIDEADTLIVPDILQDGGVEAIFMDLSEYFISDVHEIKYIKVELYFTSSGEGEDHLWAIVFYRADGGHSLVIDSLWPFGLKVANESDLARLASESETPPVTVSL